MCHTASKEGRKQGAVVPGGGRWWCQSEDEAKYEDRSLAQINEVIDS